MPTIHKHQPLTSANETMVSAFLSEIETGGAKVASKVCATDQTLHDVRVARLSDEQERLFAEVASCRARIAAATARANSLGTQKQGGSESNLPSVKECLEDGSLFLGKLEDRMDELPNLARWINTRAKFNYKYRGKPKRGEDDGVVHYKNKPGRVKDDDLVALAYFSKGYGITVGYDREKNDIWFERDAPKPFFRNLKTNMCEPPRTDDGDGIALGYERESNDIWFERDVPKLFFRPSSDMSNEGCEPPRTDDEVDELGCAGRCCYRNTCEWCKDADEYWAFCDTPGCYYSECGIPEVRRATAHATDAGLHCRGCSRIRVLIDGWDKGGQAIRILHTLAINSGTGRQSSPPTLRLPKFSEENRMRGMKGKAVMLYHQLNLWTLSPGQEFISEGGDCENADAPTYENYVSLFTLFRQIFGVSFTIERRGAGHTIRREKDLVRHVDKSRGDTNIVTETRGEGWYLRDDSSPTGVLTIGLDKHLVDQVLMGAISLRDKGVPFGKIVIKTDIGRDYHPGAMVDIGRAIGMMIDDSKPGDSEEIMAWLEMGKDAGRGTARLSSANSEESVRTIVIH